MRILTESQQELKVINDTTNHTTNIAPAAQGNTTLAHHRGQYGNSDNYVWVENFVIPILVFFCLVLIYAQVDIIDSPSSNMNDDNLDDMDSNNDGVEGEQPDQSNEY